METLLRDMVGWLSVLPTLAGLIVSALNLGRSRCVGLLVGGFGVETLVSIFYRIATLMIGRGSMSTTSIGLTFTLASLVGLLANAAIVGGIAGLLSELRAAAVAQAAQVEP